MLGAIIGDIVGSRFEFNNHRSKEFDLFTSDCFVTDDSIMTLAVAKAIMEAEKRLPVEKRSYEYTDDRNEMLEELSVKYMQEIGRKYPNCGYGGMFSRWVFSDEPKPYNSYGNGAAMRVSPAGFAAQSEPQAMLFAQMVTGVTHNHEEGMKGATTVAIAIFMARRGALKNEIYEIINNYYSLDFWIDDIRDTYKFNETCQETVPQAIKAFLESNSFEDAIRTAISIGGDSDTIAAITGSIAEAYYGVPKEIKEKALTYLDDELRAIYDEWVSFYLEVDEKFKTLTKYIGKIASAESYGEWVIDRQNDGSPEHPIQMPFVGYSQLVRSFEDEFYHFHEGHPHYKLADYGGILEKHDIPWGWGSSEMHDADVSNFDEQVVLALIMGAIRSERFCDGALLGFFQDGCMLKWLQRLKDIDWQGTHPYNKIAEVILIIGGFHYGHKQYRFQVSDTGALISESERYYGVLTEKNLTPDEVDKMQKRLHDLHCEYWNYDYHNPYVLDGTQWNLSICYAGYQPITYESSNAYPSNWNELLSIFDIEPDDN